MRLYALLLSFSAVAIPVHLVKSMMDGPYIGCPNGTFQTEPGDGGPLICMAPPGGGPSTAAFAVALDCDLTSQSPQSFGVSTLIDGGSSPDAGPYVLCGSNIFFEGGTDTAYSASPVTISDAGAFFFPTSSSGASSLNAPIILFNLASLITGFNESTIVKMTVVFGNGGTYSTGDYLIGVVQVDDQFPASAAMDAILGNPYAPDGGFAYNKHQVVSTYNGGVQASANSSNFYPGNEVIIAEPEGIGKGWSMTETGAYVGGYGSPLSTLMVSDLSYATGLNQLKTLAPPGLYFVGFGMAGPTGDSVNVTHIKIEYLASAGGGGGTTSSGGGGGGGNPIPNLDVAFGLPDGGLQANNRVQSVNGILVSGAIYIDGGSNDPYPLHLSSGGEPNGGVLFDDNTDLGGQISRNFILQILSASEYSSSGANSFNFGYQGTSGFLTDTAGSWITSERFGGATPPLPLYMGAGVPRCSSNTLFCVADAQLELPTLLNAVLMGDKTAGYTASSGGTESVLTDGGLAPFSASILNASQKLDITNVGAGNSCIGSGTLSTGGTVTISTSCVTSSSMIFITDTNSSITNVGALTVASKIAGTSFTVDSTNTSDTSTFNWFIIN